MPEMPEVETIRRELIPSLVGRGILAVEFLWPPVAANLPAEVMAEKLQKQSIVDIRRRGKYLIFDLEEKSHLIVHLRMTGQLRIYSQPTAAEKHTHVVMEFDNRAQMHYWDVRKFGRFYYVKDEKQILGRLGPEPLSESWTSESFADALRHHRAPIKSTLLNQGVVAGLGNIYADEALFFAGIHPLRPASSLTTEEVQQLHHAVRYVLRQALKARGSTFSTYRRPNEETGNYQLQHQVFRRTGQPCPICGTPIERIKVGGRSTHFCPECQR